MRMIGITKLFDRSFSTKAKSQILWLSGIITFAIILTCGGLYILDKLFGGSQGLFFTKEGGENFGNSYLFEYVLSLMLDPGQIDHLHSGTIHQWSLLFAFVGVITITGITISTITNIIQRRVNLYLNGEVRYSSFHNHKVIIGFGEVALAVIDIICKSREYEENPCDIVVMSDHDSREIRQSINTIIDKRHEKYIYVYRGRKDSGEDLDSLLIGKASEVFLFGEQDEYNRDATNMEALRKIASTRNRLERLMMRAEEEEQEVGRYHLLARVSKHLKVCRLRAKIKNWDDDLENRRQRDDLEDRIPVNVLFGYQSTYAVFQVTNLSSEWKQTIDFRPFNFYESWAKKVLYDRVYTDIDRTYYFYPSIDGSEQDKDGTFRGGISYDSDKFVHLVIFGMSNMGVALGVMAAHMCHFPNFVRNKIKTRITFFSPEADVEMEVFMSRYAHFFEIALPVYRDFIDGDGAVAPSELHEEQDSLLDVEFEFVKGRAEQPGVRRLISEWAAEPLRQLSIAVCLRTPEKNMEIGLYLPDIIYEKNIPVFIRQKSSAALLSLLNKNHTKGDGQSGEPSYRKYGSVYPFGMLEDCYDLERKDIEAAMWFHYYYLEEKDHAGREILKRKELWQNLDTALQWSNQYFTYSVPFKLHSLGIEETIRLDENGRELIRTYGQRELKDGKNGEENEVEIFAKVEQNRWMVEKLLLGYKKLTDEQRKEVDEDSKKAQSFKDRYCHPDIEAYDKLDQRAKDFNMAMSRIMQCVLSRIQNKPVC